MKDNKEFIKKLNETPIKKDSLTIFTEYLIIFSLVVVVVSLIFGAFLFKL